MSQADFSREIGCSRQYVGKLKSDGHLVFVSGKVKFLASLQRMSKKLEHSKIKSEKLKEIFKNLRGTSSKLDDDQISADADTPGAELPCNPYPSVTESREKGEHFKSEIIRMDAQTKAGLLTPTQEADFQALTLATKTISSLQVTFDSLVPLLVVTTDEIKCGEILDKGLRSAVKDMQLFIDDLEERILNGEKSCSEA